MWTSFVGKLVAGLGELLLPATCAACSTLTVLGQPFCEACTDLVDTVAFPCPRCALPLATAPSQHSCLGCAKESPPWTEARAPLIFGGPLAIAVRRWKLGRDPALTPPLAGLLAPSLARVTGDVIVPVPLHPRRLREREFNQASLLARAAARLAGSGLVVEEALDRVVDTPPQARLAAKARRANVKRAFAAAKDADLRGKRVVLVDDVVTTGATAGACASALLAAGAERVDLVALARAVL